MDETTFSKFKKSLFAALAKLGMHPQQYDDGGKSVEFYMSGFATVACSVDYWNRKIVIEKFYDSERLSEGNITKEIPFDETLAVDMCKKLIANIKGDEPILNFGE